MRFAPSPCGYRFGASLVVLAWALAGGPPPAVADRRSPASALVIDGSFSDWGDGPELRTDGHDIFVRLRLPQTVDLQAGDESVVVLFDLDGDAGTGGRLPTLEVESRAEIAVVFGLPGASGRSGTGVFELAEGREPRDLGHAAIDLRFAPTHAAQEFEVRIRRGALAIPKTVGDGIGAEVYIVDAGAQVIWSRSLGRVVTPPPGPRLGVHVLPAARPEDSIRIVSWNVLFAAPMRNPDPFARILRALDPDVVLLQEWNGVEADELERWFTTNVSPGWSALVSAGWGVAIVARGSVERLVPYEIARPEGAPGDGFRPEKTLRLVAGVVRTAKGPLAVASVHLKCCGGAEGPEDRARVAEAERIREVLDRAFADLGEHAPVARVLGGDLNLVGSRRPLEVLRKGLGSAGEDLNIAAMPVSGDRAWYTWRRDRSRFAAGRLDYILFSGGDGVASFALDAQLIPAISLASLGIEAGDTSVSDHLPLVLDLRPSASTSVRKAP